MTFPSPGLEAALRRARSLSGAILLTFVLTHLVNHAAILVSLGAAETGQEWFFDLWRHGPGTVVLYGGFATHITVNLFSLYRRRNWRLPAWQISQIVLGLAIPFFLIDHVVGTRAANGALGISDTYARVLYTLWIAAPAAGVQQVIVLCIAWLHGC
ncbi:MAG: adenylate/guanylate cyclase domain-containing protein, partial [Alphaproteobacteria bacterium]